MQSIDAVLERIEAESRRKKEKLHKRLIFMLLAILFILPTALCIIIFIKMSKLDNRLDDLLVLIDEGIAINNQQATNNLKPEVTTGKTVYLTFDDGPSKNTEAILKILKEEDVKATFFVTGQKNKDKLYKKIVDEGHSIGMHSYSHVYSEIYDSVNSFKKDLYKIQSCIYDTTGVVSTIYRFPGGSSNRVSKKDMKQFIKYLNDNSYVYFDWNVSSGDAGGTQSEKTIYNNIINGVKDKDVSCVLMHDADEKSATVKALSSVIKTLKKEGVTFAALTEDSVPIQHISAKTVK